MFAHGCTVKMVLGLFHFCVKAAMALLALKQINLILLAGVFAISD
jgi:hypothetical protein